MRAEFAGAALCLICALTPIQQAAASEDIHAFDISAGSAEDSIPQFSLQSGRLILAPGDALINVKTPALRGQFTSSVALSMLLKGTELEAVSDDGRTIILQKHIVRLVPTPNHVVLGNEIVSSEIVTVTGFRASLTNSTIAKREAVAFSDSIFAEDFGKFPDTNIAESLNRIPGVTIFREINGEGVNVQIRSLGTNFTKILLNGDPVNIASTGITDATNANREVDLNMFPTELFTQLTVSKTLSADQLEGGAAGVITLRTIRPFDKPGFHASYDLQLTDQSTTNLGIGKRGTVIVSDTEGDFGFLIGLAGVQSNMMVKGFEDGNAGWVASNLPNGTCGTGNTCGQFGGNAWTIPSSVPSGVHVPVPVGFTLSPSYTADVINGVRYFPAGYPVNQAMLYALNPGLAGDGCSATNPTPSCLNQVMTRLSNALLPRLGRPMFEKGSRDRYNAVVSLEYRPNDNLHVYLDAVLGKTNNHLNRTDVGWGVRGGASATNMIPANLEIASDWLNSPLTAGLGGAVRTGTFYNATFGLEARDYKEVGDFISLNPGLSWLASERLRIDVQTYYSRGHFSRINPTIMVSTCTSTQPVAGIDNCPNGPPALGTVLAFDNTGVYPSETINLDLNDPKNYEWNLGRVNLNDSKRYTYTVGAHLDLVLGDEEFAVKVGAAYDRAHRLMTYIDDAFTWQTEICGGYPSTVVLSPNTSLPGCTGQNTSSTPAGWTVPAYAGWGTGYTAGAAPLTFRGSLVPTSDLAKYLIPGPIGFVTVDFEKIFKASNYYNVLNNALQSTYCVPNCPSEGLPENAAAYPASPNIFDERSRGLYGKMYGIFDVIGRRLRYDVGLRWVETHHLIVSPNVRADPRNATLSDGGYYPNYSELTSAKGSYQAFLPSASLAYEITDDFQVRASLSRTMNRPNPDAMTAGMGFGDPNVATATQGNTHLSPYYSNNIDFGAEFYTGGEGYVGVALFRKWVSGFTAQITTQRNFAYLAQFGITWNTLSSQQQLNYQNNGGPSGVTCNSDATCADHPIAVNQQVNLPGLEIITGLEFDAVQPLDVLTVPYLGIKGFGLTANLTVIDQRSTGSVPTYATGVAPYQFNVTGYYEDDSIMLRLSYNWNDTSYGSASNAQNICLPAEASGVKQIGCPGGAYLFTEAYGQADFASSLKLSQLFSELPSDPVLTFDIQNLFDSKQRSYDQFASTTHLYYIKGQTYLLGIRGSF